MKPEEVVNSGNAFALAFTIAFAFVYFAIIEPHFARDRSSEQHIENTLQQITTTEIELQDKLSRIRSRNAENWLRSPAPLVSSKTNNSRDKSSTPSQNEKDEDSESLIREKLVQLGVAHQSLSKAKSEKKDYSIPIISVSVDEQTLLKFFPTLVLIGLVRLLFYRASFLRIVEPTADTFMPVWVAPLPFCKTRLSFGKWVGVNLLGFIGIGSILFLLSRFVFLYARENHASLTLVSVEAILIALLTVTYLFLIASAIFRTPKSAEMQIEEFEL
jgi:hypothetical protein